MRGRVVPICVLITLGATSGLTQAQNKLTYHGSELFRFALHQKGLTPISGDDWRNKTQLHKDMMIVIIGDTSAADSIVSSGLRDFVDRGGALLILTDQPHTGPIDWRTSFGIAITGNPLRAARGEGYRGEDEKPFVRPRTRVNNESPSPFDLFNGVEVGGANGVATDQPAYLLLEGARPPLLKKEIAGYADGTWQRNRQPLAGGGTFAVSLEPTNGVPGRMVVLANSRVFANGMMGFRPKPDVPGDYENDNGNWEFSNRTIDWLQGGYSEKRSLCLFIEDGKIVDKFAEKIPGMPNGPPDIDPAVLANWALHRANQVIPWAEENNFFNDRLERIFGFSRLVRLFLIVVTVVFAFAVLRWFTRGQRKPEPSATITKSVQGAMLPRGGVMRQRTAAQFEVGNLYEAARRRVRSRFDVLGGRPSASDKMPPVLTANDLADGPLIYQSVRWLWAIGYGATPVAVPTGDWDRLNVTLERMAARAARGDWSFGQDV